MNHKIGLQDPSLVSNDLAMQIKALMAAVRYGYNKALVAIMEDLPAIKAESPLESAERINSMMATPVIMESEELMAFIDNVFSALPPFEDDEDDEFEKVVDEIDFSLDRIEVEDFDAYWVQNPNYPKRYTLECKSSEDRLRIFGWVEEVRSCAADSVFVAHVPCLPNEDDSDCRAIGQVKTAKEAMAAVLEENHPSCGLWI